MAIRYAWNEESSMNNFKFFSFNVKKLFLIAYFRWNEKDLKLL